LHRVALNWAKESGHRNGVNLLRDLTLARGSWILSLREMRGGFRHFVSGAFSFAD